jgi:Ca2+-binding EF-hand superfamily protein
MSPRSVNAHRRDTPTAAAEMEEPMLSPKLVAASLVAFELAGPVVAREDLREQPDVQFEQLDRNGDAFLSRDEVAPLARIAARFEKFDLNRDGRLDSGEFRALLASLRSASVKSP